MFLSLHGIFSEGFTKQGIGLPRRGDGVLTLFSILIDAPVRTEEAHACHARDGFGQPLVLILVRLVNGRMRLNVAVEVV